MPKKSRLIQRKSPACDSKKLNQQIKHWKDKYDLLQEQCNQLWSSIQQQQQSDTSESSNNTDVSDSDDSDYMDDSDNSDESTTNVQINEEKFKNKMLLLTFKLGLKGNASITQISDALKDIFMECWDNEKYIEKVWSKSTIQRYYEYKLNVFNLLILSLKYITNKNMEEMTLGWDETTKSAQIYQAIAGYYYNEQKSKIECDSIGYEIIFKR